MVTLVFDVIDGMAGSLQRQNAPFSKLFLSVFLFSQALHAEDVDGDKDDTDDAGDDVHVRLKCYHVRAAHAQ